MKLGERLRALRATTQWTQKELALHSDIEQSYLSKLENNRAIPTIDILEKLATIYNISLMELIEGVDTNFLSENFGNIGISAKERQLKKLAQKLHRSWVALVSIWIGLALLSGGVLLPTQHYHYLQSGPRFYTKQWLEKYEEPRYGFASTGETIELDYYAGEILEKKTADFKEFFLLEKYEQSHHPWLILMGGILMLMGIGYFCYVKVIYRIDGKDSLIGAEE